MLATVRRTLLLPAAALTLAAGALGAQAPAAATNAAPAAPPAPDVGAMAPDFTISAIGHMGAEPMTLSAQRGKVVVLAFYPKDRTSGCTAELTRFRDEYATLFGPDVVVLPISADSANSHTAWAHEMSFPFALGADTTLAVADLYGSRTPGRAASNRTVFVIGKDGRIAYRDMKFNALAENAYTALAAEIAKAR